MATGNTSARSRKVILADVEFTENGLYIPNEEITGFGKVTVAVPPDARRKPIYITPSATDVISKPTWDEYTGPYVDEYVKTIGYKKEDRTIYDFNNNYLGTCSIEGVITDNSGNVIGKVSNYRVIRDENNKIVGYADDKNFAFNLENDQIGKVLGDNSVINDEGDIIGQASSTEYLAYNNDENEFVGVRDIKVRKIGAWIDSNISADNIRQGHTILGVSGNVVELLGEERTVNSSTSTQTITPSNGKNGITKVTVNPYTLGTRTVDPEFSTKTYYTPSGYNGMSSFTVNPIDVQTIVEEEPQLKAENIKKNVRLFDGQIVGTYDNYVAPVVQPVSISPTTSQQIVNAPSGVDGFNKVTVDAVTSTIDPNIQASNIKKDVTILGITGTYRTENLQDKTVDPQQFLQVVSYDSTQYDGLNSVTVNAVTNAIDANIQAGNIKKNVQILGVTGEYDPQPNIQAPVTVTPTTLQQSVTPDQGYDGLGRVDINAVTSSIDPNILAENIKKNIEILGVTGSYDPQPKYQASKTIQPVSSGDVEVTADPTYDALLKVIVKAVTASIDPNIMPKNIRKNISILGVLGTMEEGGGQKWFDFSGIQNFAELNQDAFSEGGPESIPTVVDKNNYELKKLIDDTFPAISNINAVLLSEVYGYNDEEITDPITKQCYIDFVGGYMYQDYSTTTYISNQSRYFYSFDNDYSVNGLTIGLADDDGSARTMKLYVAVDSTKNNTPIPVLVNGNMSVSDLPEDYDEFRYVKDIEIPAHDVYIPKFIEEGDIQWVLRDEDGIRTKLIEPIGIEPNNVEVSAYDIDYGTQDVETDSVIGYRLRHFNNLALNENTLIASQKDTNKDGTILILNDFVKQDQSYYYFAFKPSVYNGSNTYHLVAKCDGLFQVGFYRNGSDSYYRPAWISSWSSASAGTWSNNSTSDYRMYNGTTYYYRIYVNGTTTTIDWSNNGTTWVKMGTVTSDYINPLNTNQVEIYAKSGPNTQLCTDGIYLADSLNNVLYSVLDDKIAKKTSHNIVPLDDNNLFVQRADNRVSPRYIGTEDIRFISYDKTNKLLNTGQGGYIELQDEWRPGNKPWQINVHLKYYPRTEYTTHLVSWKGSTSARNVFWFYKNLMYGRICGSASSTIFDGRLSDYTFVNGQDYYIQMGWNTERYYVQVATDPNFTNLIINYQNANSNATYCQDTKLEIYNHEKRDYGSPDYLYLDEYTNVMIDDKVIWKPADKELCGNLVNYDDTDGLANTLDVYLASKQGNKVVSNTKVIGDIKIDNNFVASRFTQGSFIKVDTFYPASGDTWEICIKTTTGSNVTRNQYFFGNYIDNYSTPQLCIDGSKLHLYLSSNGSSWGIANNVTSTLTIEPNTEYVIKLYFDGTAYKVDVNDTNYITVTSSTSIYSVGKPWAIGLDWQNLAYPGYIDLKDSYIKVNDSFVWKPEYKIVNNYDWIFTKDSTWSYQGLTNLGKKGTVVTGDHTYFDWDYDQCKWVGSKKVILNVNDPDGILYAEVMKG